ncbi:hypothetical protein [Embleya scabrispora]|uniref:hypothetical protein n=1 Tax=Embleya scabrispora TaxID=159449 RepID=UPI0019622AC8|nr:hypothetical protein [Embleya scabrispora]
MNATIVLTEKWPVSVRHEQAAAWLSVWTDLGRAPRTIDAYGRGLAEYLLMCERERIDPVTANRSHIALYVRELTSRPHRRGANVISIDSGSGLANATIQDLDGADVPFEVARLGVPADRLGHVPELGTAGQHALELQRFLGGQ